MGIMRMGAGYDWLPSLAAEVVKRMKCLFHYLTDGVYLLSDV